MPQRISWRLIMAFMAAWVTCLSGPGCQNQLAWVPPEARPPVIAAGDAPVIRASGQLMPVNNQSNYPNGFVQAGCNGPNCMVADGNMNSMNGTVMGPGNQPVPVELQKVSHPPYMVEPPDILLIDAIRFVPKPPYRIEPLDQLLIQATETFPTQPIAGVFTVSPDGFLSLGYSYGSLRISGMTLEQAEIAVRTQLGRTLRNPGVSVGLATFRGVQQVRGEHLVRPDGTLSLGTYGCVHVAGLTLAQIKTVIERHLSQYLQDPEVAVDVFAYNSKAYYVITDGAGYGQQVIKFPITGNETVLDAIERIQGLPAVSSKKSIWVARPAPPGHPCNQLLPVDWIGITQGGSTATNYQLFPGDRIYVKADPLIKFDYTLAKVLSPIQRVLGVTLLGASTYSIIRNANNGTGGTGGVLIAR